MKEEDTAAPGTHRAPPTAVPAGTVYGRGGLPVDGPKLGLLSRLHPAITASVAASVIAVLALGYLTWRSFTNAAPETAGPAAAQAALPPVTDTLEASPSPSPSASPKARALAPGTWSLESVDDPGRYVRRASGLGVIETIDATSGAQVRRDAALVVTEGLADRSCFTFRTTDGRYLRHFAFRLRFDRPDRSELFGRDATFCAEAGAGGDSVRLRSLNYPDRAIHHRGSELWLDKVDRSRTFSTASSFTVRDALS